MTPLRPGARVALVSPAGPTPAALVDRAQGLLRSWGLEPVIFPSVHAEHPRARYLSGDDATRAADVQGAWCDPDVDAVLCLRGGYGTVRVLDLLDREPMGRARPKPVLGSSDVTALHEWLRENVGAPSWFTPMLGVEATLDDAAEVEGVRRALLCAEPLELVGEASLVPGEAEGELVGGNLSLLAMTLGARGRQPLDHRGCVVLLEDVGEPVYRLDGYLRALLRAGWFDGVAGVVLGSWVDCGDLDEVRALCHETFAPLGVPVAWGLPFGHCRGAASVPLGVHGRLVADHRPRLAVEPTAGGTADHRTGQPGSAA